MDDVSTQTGSAPSGIHMPILWVFDGIVRVAKSGQANLLKNTRYAFGNHLCRIGLTAGRIVDEAERVLSVLDPRRTINHPLSLDTEVLYIVTKSMLDSVAKFLSQAGAFGHIKLGESISNLLSTVAKDGSKFGDVAALVEQNRAFLENVVLVRDNIVHHGSLMEVITTVRRDNGGDRCLTPSGLWLPDENNIYVTGVKCNRQDASDIQPLRWHVGNLVSDLVHFVQSMAPAVHEMASRNVEGYAFPYEPDSPFWFNGARGMLVAMEYVRQLSEASA